MYKLAKPLFIHCQSPMHVGSGSDLGLVDNPIQRESHTGFPKIEASSLKGAIRENFEGKVTKETGEKDWFDIQLAFGYDKDGLPKVKGNDGKETSFEDKHFKDSKDRDYSGALAFSDARLLLFPVKSFKGIFAYVTCPQVIERFRNDLQICEGASTNEDISKISNVIASSLPKKYKVASLTELTHDKKIFLEEYAFDVEEDDQTTKSLAKELGSHLNIDLTNKLVVLPDDVFSDFVKLFTEVITRNKINNETGTVAKGALFTEEYLPAESVFYSLVFSNSIFTANESRKGSFNKDDKESEEQKVQNYFAKKVADKNGYMQIGGNSTLGKGIVKTKF